MAKSNPIHQVSPRPLAPGASSGASGLPPDGCPSALRYWTAVTTDVALHYEVRRVIRHLDGSLT
jgi:hypothetical protein